ncbi:alpha/beta fold hydrolase [Paracoccus sp. M683]|uniref:alpha/beta hydrolase family protein n=1 Tax=Paracoccus sp. M683 TaxID=2594268 RepID=UPI00163DA509|nr:alpha/beta fold hydrolase [Paracoccus sp. M683]
MERCVISVATGGRIPLTLFGRRSKRKAIVVIQPATAITERMYWPFASYLAQRDFLVATYNYRGVGPDARDPALRDLGMRDWALTDARLVLDWLAERFPDLPILIVGHSLGGHAVGLNGGDDRVSAAALIASHLGADRLVPSRIERWRIRAMSRLVAPIASAIAGYFPARLLGVGEDMPTCAMREWSSWMAMPRYFFDDASLQAEARFARVRIPVLACGFDDDPWATPEAIGRLLEFLPGAQIRRRQVDPVARGLGPVGHMGFFRSRQMAVLWPELADWLDEQAAIACSRDQRSTKVA